MSTSVFDLDTARLTLLCKWISYCIHRHPKCGSRELRDVFPGEVNIILIDVKRMCIVEAATSDRYLALSYVWGQAYQYNTLTSNVRDLKCEGALEKVLGRIPNVIRDAIKLTRSLGETHLWVDSLCIVQDDPAVKHQQLSAMAEIYNSATATIIACASRSADTPLFHSLATSLSEEEVLKIDTTYESLPFKYIRRPRTPITYPYIYRTDIRRPNSIKSEVEKIASSYHSQRGWTYQERMLSRRRIYFFENEVVFRCRSDCFTEAGEQQVQIIVTEDLFAAADDPHDTETETDYFEYKLARFRDQNGLGSEWPSHMQPTDWDLGFRFWSNCVKEYSTKNFSFSTDILDAFIGILHAFEGYSQWHILEGMPEEIFDLALLWTPVSSATRRPAVDVHGKSTQFPSWSWLGWEGAVEFPLVYREAGFGSQILAFKHISDEMTTTTETSVRLRVIKDFDSGVAISQPHKAYLRFALEGRGGEPAQAVEYLAPPSKEPNWHQKIANTLFGSKEIVKLPEIHENNPSPSSTLLSFLAFAVPGTSFLQHSQLSSTTSFNNQPQSWLYLCRRANKPCGVLYGLSEAQASRLSFTSVLDKLYFILLSDGQLTPYEQIPRMFKKDGDNIATIGFWPLFGKPTTVVNVMLIESKGGYAERVAIGQVLSDDWKDVEPVLHLVTLG